MLFKFTDSDSEDAYIFIDKFEEVSIMMKIQQLDNDALDITKKWL